MHNNKHVGTLASSGVKVIVLYAQTPGADVTNPYHALVVEPTALTDNFYQTITEHLESSQGQQTENFGDHLNRIGLQGDNRTLLQILQEAGKIRRVHIDDVVMMPEPGARFPLRQVLEFTGKLSKNAQDPTKPEQVNPKLFNPHENNQDASSSETRLAEARGYLVQADLLTAEANKFRHRAYEIAPQLKEAAKAESAPAPVTELPAEAASDAESQPTEAPVENTNIPVEESTPATTENTKIDGLDAVERVQVGTIDQNEK